MEEIFQRLIKPLAAMPIPVGLQAKGVAAGALVKACANGAFADSPTWQPGKAGHSRHFGDARATVPDQSRRYNLSGYTRHFSRTHRQGIDVLSGQTCPSQIKKAPGFPRMPSKHAATVHGRAHFPLLGCQFADAIKAWIPMQPSRLHRLAGAATGV